MFSSFKKGSECRFHCSSTNSEICNYFCNSFYYWFPAAKYGFHGQFLPFYFMLPKQYCFLADFVRHRSSNSILHWIIFWGFFNKVDFRLRFKIYFFIDICLWNFVLNCHILSWFFISNLLWNIVHFSAWFEHFTCFCKDHSFSADFSFCFYKLKCNYWFYFIILNIF